MATVVLTLKSIYHAILEKMKTILSVLGLLQLCGYAFGSINFMLLGDWGADPFLQKDSQWNGDPEIRPFGVDDQHRVRDQMDVWAGQFGCDFILTGADNFYPDGVVSLDDPRWDIVWRDVYNTSNLQGLVWYPTLGNHDHFIDGRAWYQINMTYIDPYWHMPYFYYDFYKVKDGIKIHYIALDTELLTFTPNNREEQLVWFNETLENAEPSDWTIVYAHHPIRTCGRYAPGNVVIKRDILPALVYYEVDFYMDGHDHNLQHISKNDTTGPEFIVTGSGGKGLYGMYSLRCREMHEDGYTLDFFAERYGFVGVTVEKESVHIGYYGDMGVDGQLEELYSFTKFKNSDY